MSARGTFSIFTVGHFALHFCLLARDILSHRLKVSTLDMAKQSSFAFPRRKKPNPEDENSVIDEDDMLGEWF